MKDIIKKFFTGVGYTGLGLFMVVLGLGGFCMIAIGLPLRDDGELSISLISWGFAMWLLLGGIAGVGGAFDESEGYSTHTCDFCGGKIKIGTGRHWPKQKADNCTCACDKCLPTVQE